MFAFSDDLLSVEVWERDCIYLFIYVHTITDVFGVTYYLLLLKQMYTNANRILMSYNDKMSMHLIIFFNDYFIYYL